MKDMIIISCILGKSIGLISTARVTHATPASMYANAASRYWEYDSKIPAEEAAKGCKDISHQLLTKGRDYKVKKINIFI